MSMLWLLEFDLLGLVSGLSKMPIIIILVMKPFNNSHIFKSREYNIINPISQINQSMANYVTHILPSIPPPCLVLSKRGPYMFNT